MTTTTTRKQNTRKPRRTWEQKKVELEALHDQLGEQVEALRNSDQWAAYLTFCSSFHTYSLNNVLLILSQFEHASQVAGYRSWQKRGRQVRKGERGIRIFGTGRVKNKRDEDEDGNEDEDGYRRIFFPVSVFDISQTDPIEGKEDHSTVAHKLTGEDEAGILAKIVDYLATRNIPVRFETITGGANGFTSPANPDTGEGIKVAIDERLAPAHQAKTAIHEAAHIVLGHVEMDYKEYLAHRGRCEVEAESVAYVVAGALGLDSSDYSTGYVAGWATDAEADVLKETAGRVLKAAHEILEAITPRVEEVAA